MKREVLVQLIEDKLAELRAKGITKYQLWDFCVEVIPVTERQSKHIDILEYLLDEGYELIWRGLKFQPKKRN